MFCPHLLVGLAGSLVVYKAPKNGLLEWARERAEGEDRWAIGEKGGEGAGGHGVGEGWACQSGPRPPTPTLQGSIGFCLPKLCCRVHKQADVSEEGVWCGSVCLFQDSISAEIQAGSKFVLCSPSSHSGFWGSSDTLTLHVYAMWWHWNMDV